MKEYHSVFDHALGPITPGPSSSNTCGPVRIGMVARQLLGSAPTSARIEYYTKGAFTTTLYGMKSDIAFINGLLGREQNSPDFGAAYELARRAGMDVSFAAVDDLTIGGMETARIVMEAADGFKMTVIGESLGGGAIKIHRIDDCEVDIRGMNWELLVFVRGTLSDAEAIAARVRSELVQVNEVVCCGGRDMSIVDARCAAPQGDDVVARIAAMDGVAFVRTVDPVFPVVADVSRTLPFETPDEFVAYCKSHGASPARAAIDYEAAISGWDESRVQDYAKMLLGIMRRSDEGGMTPGLEFDGIVGAAAASMRGRIGRGAMPSLGILDDAIPSALGIMEHSNATGQIVCVPTGGSSGIVPALLLSAAKSMGADDRAIVDGLMAAGIIGVLMMVDGNEFAGGTHGCQAEIACGTAMAAAGLVQMMGGDAQQACDAASMSLQCFLGLICDPVGGLVQVPCLARNIAGVSVAAAAAESVCAGFDVVIGLEEMSRAMIRVGTDMTKELGMCCSGCCITPTGRRLTAEYAAHRKEQLRKEREGC